MKNIWITIFLCTLILIGGIFYHNLKIVQVKKTIAHFEKISEDSTVVEVEFKGWIDDFSITYDVLY